jgi:hypothetical protein
MFRRVIAGLAAPSALVFAVACLPSRPAGVPEDAQWAGTRSQGCFLIVGKREFSGWHMEGWDKDGNKIVEGIWELDGIARAKIRHEDIVKFDGQTFYMDDGGKIAKIAN